MFSVLACHGGVGSDNYAATVAAFFVGEKDEQQIPFGKLRAGSRRRRRYRSGLLGMTKLILL
jgi:hypothetical protein